jgi:hypothetical protein
MTGLDESETGTSMIHQCIHAVALLLSVITALGHSLDVTVPCHVSTTFLSVPGCDRSAKSV